MILLLTLLGLGVSVGLADVFGLTDDDETQERIDTLDEETAFALLDEDALDALREELQAEVDLAAIDGTLNAGLVLDPELSFSEIEGTAGDDLIQTSPETVLTSGQGGDDTILGTDSEYENIFGDEGDDVLFGAGGADLIVGGTGDDLISGDDGDDELVGQAGTDTIFGGDGNDILIDAIGVSSDQPPAGVEGLNAGAGDDQVRVYDGLNVVQLGAGADALAVYNPDDAPEDPIAVVTDFDPSEDALILGVQSDDPDLISDNIQTLDFTAELIETNLGPATLIVPATEDAALAEALSSASVGVAVLQGVVPEDLEGAEIAVVLMDGDHNSVVEDGISTLIKSAVG